MSNDNALYFNADKLPDPKHAYVAWLDVVGVQTILKRSLHVSANFVFKLHEAVLKSAHKPTDLYPVMDGVFVVVSRRKELEDFYRDVFFLLASEFLKGAKHQHRFIVRSGVAFGPVVHGKDIDDKACETFANSKGYRRALLLGMPMVQAFNCERLAPPFGVYVHESARAFAPEGDSPFNYTWWHWWRNRGNSRLAVDLKGALVEYFDYCAERCEEIEYDKERIRVHREMAEQQFVDLEEGDPE